MVARLNPSHGGRGKGDWPGVAVEAAALEAGEVESMLAAAVVW